MLDAVCQGFTGQPTPEYSDHARLWELRQLITNFLRPARGMVVFAEQVLIVAGCQQGLNLAAHLFVGTNTPVVVGSPCYRGAAFLFESFGGKLIPVPVYDRILLLGYALLTEVQIEQGIAKLAVVMNR
jgi:GntR family transcriptional regulator / MocR family aminotransferase